MLRLHHRKYVTVDKPRLGVLGAQNVLRRSDTQELLKNE